MALVVVEGIANSDVISCTDKIEYITKWPVYTPTYVNLRPSSYVIERSFFEGKNRIVDLLEDVKCSDVILPSFYFGVTIDGIVDAGWYAHTAVKNAESLSKRLSDLGAVLILCDGNKALRSGESDSDAMQFVKASLYDLLYMKWAGQKCTVTQFQYGIVADKLKNGEKI